MRHAGPVTVDSAYIGKLLEASVERDAGGKDVAVAFSGGLDSGLLAVLAGKHAGNVVLYTVGTPGSYDVRMAEDMSSRLGMEWRHIRLDADSVESGMKEMISVTGTTDPVTLSFEIPLFFVCRDCVEKNVISGQGADEMFLGYSKYVGLDRASLTAVRGSDTDKLNSTTLAHESKVAARFGKTVSYPFLDASVTAEVMKADIDDLRPGEDGSRKNVLREIAGGLGYPYVADKKKKAAQYGSGAMDVIRDVCKTKNITYPEWVAEMEDDPHGTPPGSADEERR